MKEIIFVVFILIWVFTGFLGILWKEEDVTRSGVAMGLFIAGMPAIPLVANLCGLI